MGESLFCQGFGETGKRLKVKDLDKLPDEEVMKELVAVKGIGRWTSEMFLMFSLARADIFPIDDLGIKKGVEKLTKKRLEGPPWPNSANAGSPIEQLPVGMFGGASKTGS